MSNQEEFVVLPASCQEDFDFVINLCKEDKWHNIGVHSVSHFKQWKPGFFIGYLNGQRIGTVGAFDNADVSGSILHLGFFMMKKAFRGQGYGLKIQKVMYETLPKEGNGFLVASMDKVKLFESYGFRQESSIKEHTVLSSKVVDGLGKMKENSKSSGLEIKPLNEIDFEKLLEYDTSVLGFTRREFLQRWITIPECLAWAAMNKTGDIVGYVVIQQSVTEKQQTVGPFYSNDLHITRSLLLKATEEAILQRSAEILRMWIPVLGDNPETAEMIEAEIGCESIREFAQMYTKGIPPNLCAKKIVAVTSAAFAN